MSYQLNNQQKLDDIIFANRNKSYGAYVLRSSYGITVLKSISCTAIGFISIMLLGYFLTRPKTKPSTLLPNTNDDRVYVIPFGPPPPAQPPADQKTTPPAQSIENKSETGNPVVVDSVRTVSEVTLTSTSQGVTVNSLAVTGDTGSSSATGTGSVAIINFGSDIKGAYEVDSQPEFEGGLKALYRFVSSNVKYPNRAIIEGEEGIVYVKFVVDENGKIGSLSLLNNAGYGFDEEALRVVGMIPPFKTPAMAKGRPVKVYYQLPIRFRMKY